MITTGAREGAEAPGRKNYWECPGASAWQQLVAVCSHQWEQTKPKGRCQCHADGGGEGQGQNCGYVHGNHPSSAVLRLPEQGKDIHDCHHSSALLITATGNQLAEGAGALLDGAFIGGRHPGLRKHKDDVPR